MKQMKDILQIREERLMDLDGFGLERSREFWMVRN